MRENYYSDYHQENSSPTHVSEKNLYVIPDIKGHYLANPVSRETIPPSHIESLDLLVIDHKAKNSDISDIITDDKLKLLGATSRLLKSQILKRSKIRDDNLYHLDYKIIQCETYMIRLEGLWPGFSNPMAETKKANLGQSVTRLESEKSAEVVKCWNDQVRIYSELMSTLGEYQKLIRRTQLLNGDLK